MSEQRSGYTIKKDKNDEGYLVLPMAYRDGMKAYANDKTLPVKQGNGIMTVIPVEKGQEKIELKYTPPHTTILVVLSVLGIILSIGFTKWIKPKN